MRHIRLPKHWLNLCKTCNYTWYPKGKAVSAQCPRCGARNVTLAPFGCAGCLKGCGWLVIALFVLSALSKGCSGSTSSPAPTVISTPFASPTATPSFPPRSPIVSGTVATPEVRRAVPVATATLPPLPLDYSDSPPPIVPPGRYTVSGIARNDLLNVRSNPASNSTVVARLPNGYSGIQIVGVSVMNGPTEWVPISFNGKSGWVTKNYLKAE